MSYDGQGTRYILDSPGKGKDMLGLNLKTQTLQIWGIDYMKYHY